MEKLIRQLLNYDADTASKQERQSLIDAVMVLSLNLLSKDERYKPLKKIDYVLTDEVNGGRYGKNGMRLNSNIFCDSSAYLNDLSILSHEIDHYAQDNLVDQSVLAKSDSRLICSSTHYYLLLYFIMQREFPTSLQLAEIFGLRTATNSDERLRKISNYFHSFYELQSFEIDANNFSIEFLRNFISMAKTIPLTADERLKLKEYNSSVNSVIKSFSDYIESLKCIRQNSKNQELVKKSVQNVMNDIFESFPDFFEVKKFEPDSDLDTMATLLGQCLEIAYDDEIAHAFFKQLAEMESDENRDEKLLNLCLFTNIKFNKDEENLFKTFIETTNIIGSQIDYNTLMNEKNRVLTERMQMNNPSPANQKQ